MIIETLTALRDRNTPPPEFRERLVKLGEYMAYELAKYLRTEEWKVITPLGKEVKGLRIRDRGRIILISVLRAAIPFSQGILKVFPEAKQGLISARRVEETHRPSSLEFEVEINYVNLPKIGEEDVVVIADPMLATGSTLSRVIREVLRAGKPRKLFILTAISTKVAIERLLREFETVDMEILTASVDPYLDERGYIVPGLGDAGDRAFGTL